MIAPAPVGQPGRQHVGVVAIAAWSQQGGKRVEEGAIRHLIDLGIVPYRGKHPPAQATILPQFIRRSIWQSHIAGHESPPMIRAAAAAALSLLAGAQDRPEPAPDPHGLTAALQIVVRQQIMIRVPQHPGGVPATSLAAPMRWREGGSVRCVPAAHILAALPSQNNVDFILRDNSRIRARLGRRCAGLDYYRGIYVDAAPDGRICAGRDALRSRMGGTCDIADLHPLQLARP